MLYQVEMLAWGNGTIRQVNVPEGEWLNAKSQDEELELVFKYGQNDFQPKAGFPSVSVGDVVRLEGKRFIVKALGFEEIGPDEHTQPLTRNERFDASFDFS